MRPVLRSSVFLVGVLCLAPALFADVVADSSLSLTNLEISAGSDSVELPIYSAEAIVFFLDSSGGHCSLSPNGPLSCIGDVQGSKTASVAGTFGSAKGTANSNPSPYTLDASSSVDIAGSGEERVIAEGDSEATFRVLPFEIVDPNSPIGTPVTVHFSAKLSGEQSASAGNYSSSAFADGQFLFILNGMIILQANPSTFIPAGPGSLVNPVNLTLQTDESLSTNVTYYFDVEAQTFAGGTLAPEPSLFAVIGLVLLSLLAYGARRGCLTKPRLD